MPTVRAAPSVRKILLVWTLLPALSVAAAAAADELLVRHFEQVCLGRERPDLLGSPSGPWIAGVCVAEASQRALEFQAADREERLTSLAGDCHEWHARNAWRFGKRVLADETRWSRIVTHKCRAEALEELPRVEAKLPGAATVAQQAR